MVPCLAIHDTMRHIKSDVGTVGFGGCMGMSGFLLAVGKKVRMRAARIAALVAPAMAVELLGTLLRRGGGRHVLVLAVCAAAASPARCAHLLACLLVTSAVFDCALQLVIHLLFTTVVCVCVCVCYSTAGQACGAAEHPHHGAPPLGSGAGAGLRHQSRGARAAAHPGLHGQHPGSGHGAAL